MSNAFKREKKELAYKAHIFDVYDDYLVLPDGNKVVYDFIDHVPGACILPVDNDGNIFLVSQYRNAVDKITVEAPAGSMESGETPKQCAYRELQEETGFIAKEIIEVMKTYLVISTSNEYTYIFIGKNLHKGKKNMDPEEFINVKKYTLDEALKMIKNGEIIDSKTIIAIYSYAGGFY